MAKLAAKTRTPKGIRMTDNENPDKGPLLTAQVIALGALAYLDGQMCRLGCKLFVKAALHSPTPTAVEFCHVMEKRFYFRGMSARDTLADCIAYLDPTKAPEPKPHQELGPLHWNGETFETEAEYHAAVDAYRQALLAQERKEIEAEMGRTFASQEEYEREARAFYIAKEEARRRALNAADPLVS